MQLRFPLAADPERLAPEDAAARPFPHAVVGGLVSDPYSGGAGPHQNLPGERRDG